MGALGPRILPDTESLNPILVLLVILGGFKAGIELTLPLANGLDVSGVWNHLSTGLYTRYPLPRWYYPVTGRAIGH